MGRAQEETRAVLRENGQSKITVKKIKNFRINCRSREIIRILKTTTRITAVTAQLEEEVLRESRRLQPFIHPAAVYDAQQKDKIPPEMMISPPDKWVALGAYAVTVGTEVEEAIRDASKRGETMVNDILHAVALEALEQTVSFVQRLMNEEAREESCELSGHQQVMSEQAWNHVNGFLNAGKIGVSLTAEGCFVPRYSSCGIHFWAPQKKRGSK